MTTLNPVTANPAAAAATGSSTTQDAISSEFETFIRLLTSQVRNQDPLSPLDSTQFVEQLATFSTLEQQVLSNKNLGSIAGMIGDLHALAAGEWLGQAVTVESSWAPFSGEPVSFEAEFPSDIDRVAMTVRDSVGNEIWSEDLDMTTDVHSWSGETVSGELAASNEIYQIEVETFRSGEYIGSTVPQIITTVTDVGSENGSLRLGTAINVSGDLSTVRKLD